MLTFNQLGAIPGAMPLPSDLNPKQRPPFIVILTPEKIFLTAERKLQPFFFDELRTVSGRFMLKNWLGNDEYQHYISGSFYEHGFWQFEIETDGPYFLDNVKRTLLKLTEQ